MIGRAIAGEAPNAFDWGPLTASEFLQAVRDVTRWALTNFEAFNARPAAESLPVLIWLTGTPLFGKSPRYQPSFDSARTVRMLSSVNDPALRWPALRWAHFLLSEMHRWCNPKNRDQLARQGHLLRSHCPTGLHWLRERMVDGLRPTYASIGRPLSRCFGRKNEPAVERHEPSQAGAA